LKKLKRRRLQEGFTVLATSATVPLLHGTGLKPREIGDPAGWQAICRVSRAVDCRFFLLDLKCMH
jgi:hypothetical protein